MKALIGSIIFALVGLTMLWGAWYCSKDTRRFLQNAVSVTGKVIELKQVVNHADDSAKTSVAHYPVIRFSTRDNRQITFKSDTAVDPNEYPEGESIKVLYNKADPHRTRINSYNSLWASSLILAIMGVLFLGAACLTYFLIYREVRVNSTVFVMIGLLCTSALMLWGTYAFGKKSMDLLKHGVQTIGVVVSDNASPLIEYRTPDHKVYKVQSHIASDPPKYYQGDRVPMIYDPARPSQAKINTFGELWMVPMIFAGFAVAFFGALVWLIIYQIKNVFH